MIQGVTVYNCGRKLRAACVTIVTNRPILKYNFRLLLLHSATHAIYCQFTMRNKLLIVTFFCQVEMQLDITVYNVTNIY